MTKQTAAEIEQELRERFPNGPSGPTQTIIATAHTDGIVAVGESITFHTPGDNPNVRVVAVTIMSRVVIRAVKTYLQSLVGFLIAAGFTGAVAPGSVPLPFQTFTDVLTSAAVAALVPAIMSALTNLTILFTRLDESSPSLMA